MYRLRGLVFGFCAVVLLAAGAGSLTAQDQVRASLVAADAAVTPGRPVTVALRLDHDPKWHTYWINPGTGYPTSITWTLPEGWTAGEIEWPAPVIIRDSRGVIVGNGYEYITYLPVTLTPPVGLAAGGVVTFTAAAEWLMCEDVCIPGEAVVSLSLPVVAGEPPADGAHGAAIRATMAARPRAVEGLEVVAWREGDKLVVGVERAAGAEGVDGGQIPEGLWFFADDALVQYDELQTLRQHSATRAVVVLPVSAGYDGDGSRLIGVWRGEGSWTTAGEALPGLRVEIPVAANAPAGWASAGGGASGGGVAGSIGATLALAFVGGLILNLMPCVFPVLGIKILGFVNQAGSDRRKVALHGLAFAGGVLASFWVLAGVLAVLRAGGEQLGWGFQLQSPVFVFGLAIVMLVFALAMSGVFEFGLGATGVGAGWQSKGGLGGSFFTGVLATVVATPCSAPFLAPALGAALALPLATSFVVFTAIALGLGLPYLLLSLFPGAVKVLPRPGAWMETFKQAMAFPLYATVGYLVWVLAGQTSADAFLMLLFGLTVVAMGVWFYGRYNTPGALPARARLGLIGGLVLLTAGTALGWPKTPPAGAVEWAEWSPAAVAAARAEGRPIYVDFTARWCATCQTNKKFVFASQEVNETFARENVLALRADWTNRDAAITEELARWGRSAVPFNLLYHPDRPEPMVLPEILTPGIVLEALR